MSFIRHRTALRALQPLLLGAVALLAWALPAGAARVVDVRIGLHDQYTRVVLETDAPSKYRIERDASGAIEVYLSASASADKKTSRSPLLSTINVSPEADGSRVRLELRGSKVDVRELVLAKPHRIVLDLRPAPAGAATRPAATAPATPKAPPEAAAAPKPAPAAAVVAPKPAPERAASPKPETGFAAEPKPQALRGEEIGEIADPAVAERARKLSISQPSSAVIATEGSQRQAAAGRAVGEPSSAPAPHLPAVAPTLTRTPDPAPETAGEDSTAAMIAAMEEQAPPEPGDDAADSAQPAPDAALAPGERGDELAAALPPETDDSRALAPAVQPPQAGAATRTLAAESSPAPRSGPLPGFLSRPIALAAIAAVALVALLFVFLRRRGGEPELLGSVTHDAEPYFPDVGSVEYDVVAAPEPVDAVVDDFPALPRASHAARGPGQPNFDDVKEAVAVNESFDTAMDSGFGAPPGIGGGMNTDLMRMVEELGRRVALLEKRLDETVEAKERLERQVAAQTEELRVQRSAIARTQRALRSIAKPEDEATEPVSKG